MADSKAKITANIIPFDWTRSVSEKEISIFKEENKIWFPKDYLNFILKFNGAEKIEPRTFYFVNPKLYSHIPEYRQSSYIECLYSLNTPPNKNTYSVTENIRLKQNRIPPGFIPIGRDTGDNEICLCLLEGPDYGAIYFWDHEFEEEKPTINNMTKISESFSNFLENLV